jgi:uncharacterized protein (TIGR02996 family)
MGKQRRSKRPGTNLDYITEPEYRAQLSEVRFSLDDRTRRGVLADWVQDHGDEEEAERIRRAVPLRIFSHATGCGTFAVTADWVSLLWPLPHPHLTYALGNDRFPAFSAQFRSPYDGILMVAQHRTGLPEWDASEEEAPDYARLWQRYPDANLARRLLRVFLALCPDVSMLGIVEHFEQQREPFLERFELKRVLIQLLDAGEVNRVPNMRLAPAELRSFTRKRRKPN